MSISARNNVLRLLLAMVVTLVGSAHTENAASGTSIGIARTVSAGNLVVCVITVDDGATITNVTDGTTTKSSADIAFDWAAGVQRLAMYSFPNYVGGSSKFTANFSGTQTFRQISAVELTGADKSTPFEGSASANGNSAAPATGNVSPSPTLDGTYILGYALGATALTSAGGYADLVNDPTIVVSDVEGLAQSVHAATGPSWTMASGIWGAVAASYKPESSKNFYLNNPVQGGSNAGLLDVTAPTASTSTTGWTVGATAVNQYSRVTYNSEIASAGFTSTAQPSGIPVNLGEDCYRLSGVTTGQFSAGTWYSSLSVLAVSSGGIQHGRGRFRVWRSANADGTSGTELTQGTMIGSQVTELNTSVAQSSSASTLIGASNLTNEFLFYQAAWETL